MRVAIPHVLLSYTGQCAEVAATGTSLDGLLHDLDRQFPGLRFRIVNEQDQMRQHIVFFVNGVKVHDLEKPLADTDEVMIMQALSGG